MFITVVNIHVSDSTLSTSVLLYVLFRLVIYVSKFFPFLCFVFLIVSSCVYKCISIYIMFYFLHTLNSYIYLSSSCCSRGPFPIFLALILYSRMFLHASCFTACSASYEYITRENIYFNCAFHHKHCIPDPLAALRCLINHLCFMLNKSPTRCNSTQSGPCAQKQMLRWFIRFQVATTCFSCSFPDLNLVVTNFMFGLNVK